jgi:hypothetical protein
MEDVELKDEERTKCEVWTRVMGYHRPVDDFNIGKKGEYAERLHFSESVTRNNCIFSAKESK